MIGFMFYFMQILLVYLGILSRFEVNMFMLYETSVDVQKNSE